MASGGLLRASPGQRLRRLGQELLPYRSGTQMGACGHRCGVDAPSQPANSRRERRAIAIVTALDIYRGARRGFLPRGLCNTCPTAVRVLDRLCGWAGVTQALTIAVLRLATSRPALSYKAVSRKRPCWPFLRLLQIEWMTDPMVCRRVQRVELYPLATVRACQVVGSCTATDLLVTHRWLCSIASGFTRPVNLASRNHPLKE